MQKFQRGLSEEFIEALRELGKQPGWWKDVLDDASLVIGIRDEEFDVYLNGQSIFHACFAGGKVKVNTNVKYLLDPALEDRVALKDDGEFEAVPEPLLKRYVPGDLAKMKKAADLFSGLEKQGVHAVVLGNEDVIDVEIRLDAKDLDTERDNPRIDIAALEQRPNGYELVFWEAKLFVNPELRAKKGPAAVIGQIKEYIKVLEPHQKHVLSSYRRVAQNLVEIADMSGGRRNVGAAIRAVAAGEGLFLGTPARVGLAVFGFKQDHKRKGSDGAKHFGKLKVDLGECPIRACGKAADLRLCLAPRRFHDPSHSPQ